METVNQYKLEHVPLKKQVTEIGSTVLFSMIPGIGWVFGTIYFMGWVAFRNEERRLDRPYGYLFPHCPNCGHLFGDNESKWDFNQTWKIYTCVKCGNICTFRNLALLGGF